jgi:guanylate kinase
MGKLLIFSAPSGSGKTTLVRRLMARFPRIEFSVSATSRPPRGVEEHGRDYPCVSPDEFRRLVDEEAFVEWEEVYEGCSYGTLRSEVEAIWERGNVCAFDVDVVGGIRLKSIFGDDALSFFVMAPSPEELRRRLEGRGTDSQENIERRLAKAAAETERAGEFDHIIVNDEVERAVDETARIVAPFIARRIMLYFGSFNPVHRGHIAIAEWAIERELADVVVMVVSPQNPFKDADGLAPEVERFETVERAAASSRYPYRIQASAVEMTLPKPSYTINTLRFLGERFPGAQFSILVGGDNAEGMARWREADKIIGHYPVFVYPRPGDEKLRITNYELRDKVTVLKDAPLMDISSTEIRALLESGREHYRAGEFGAAANDFARVRELSPWSAEAAGYLEMIEDILAYRNTDLINP